MSCASVGSGSPSVWSTSYLGIRLAGHGNAALVAEGDTCMARIRGARGDAFRTGLPRLFKNVDPFRKPEASGKPCAVTQEEPTPTQTPHGHIINNLPLTPGTRLGVYEVTAQIGEGGMGQVYGARDTKLDRLVAIKILPEAFAHDADRLARFQREAKTLASLNHPHIAAIYGLEESGGITALVMELVEGPTLADLIEQRRAPGFRLRARRRVTVWPAHSR